MIDTEVTNTIKVDVYSFIEFLENANFPLSIDTYQRPYVWDKTKAMELLQDLYEHIQTDNGLPYYMGNIILHQNKKKKRLFIVDGQQRLTTLNILYYVLNKHIISEEKISMYYDSQISIKNIKKVQECFREVREFWKEYSDFLFSNIQFTFIITNSEDLAFTFFDTQNNRGVKLNHTDLLKAYHLRAISNSKLQKYSANKWEKMQQYKTLSNRDQDDFIVELFQPFLWRSRRWIGQKVIDQEKNDDILIEFMKKTTSNEANDIIPLYPNSNNVYIESIEFDVSADSNLVISKKDISNYSFFPFNIRQPISKGIGFFLYTEKYAGILQLLFYTRKIDKEIKAFRYFYEKVWKRNSKYLRELFILAIIMYYDKFRSKKIFEFSLWLDHILGAIRLRQYSIVRATPINYLKIEATLNLLDMISMSFRPEDVIDYLKSESKTITVYQSIAGEELNNVRERYQKNLLSYYDRNNFDGKEFWISPLFLEGKLK